MERYKQSFIISGSILTIMSVMPFLVGLTELDVIQILTFGGFPCLWWFAYSWLQKLRKGSFIFSWSLAILGWCKSLEWLYELRVFVIKNSGFEERGTGDGSPLAFLIYLVFMIFFFLLFSVVVLQGLSVLLEKRKKQPVDNEQVNK